MEIKTIKGISDEKWTKLKILAAKKRVTMGKIVENMIDSYEEENESFWNSILKGEKIISDKEAKELENLISNLRKEKGFRK